MTVRRILAALAMLAALPASAQDFGPLVGTVFGSGEDALVVFLHGDVSGGGDATYHERAMQQLTARNRGVVGVALVRPGYSNGRETSPGTNHDRRDQYTAENLALVAETLQSLRQAYPADRFIVVGHSGGAATLGGILGMYPGLVETAILVSCPCDIDRWRSEVGRRPFPRSEPQSPDLWIDAIAPETQIILLTGADDDNTFPALAEDYGAATAARGIATEVIIVPGAGHWDRPMASAIGNTIAQAMR